MLGRSVQGRPIAAIRVGDPHGTRMLVVGCIHGTECAGIAIARALETPTPDPQGSTFGSSPTSTQTAMPTASRHNARGVDLNR